MPLFQEQQTTQNLNIENKPKQDVFSQFGYDEAMNELQQKADERADQERQYVKNLVSPEKIKEWENKGAMTALEVWNKKNKNELIPYMGTWKEGTKAFKIKGISDKLNKGVNISPEERKMFDDFVLDMAEIQTRGYSFGGGATNIGLETIPFMAEFAVGLLTSGGSASLGSISSKFTAKGAIKSIKNAVVKELSEKTGKEILDDIAKGTAKTVYNASINPRTYAFTATRLPQQVRARMGDIMLSDSLAITPEGQAILKEAETKPATAFMKALALTNIEVASEMSGETLVRPFMHGLNRLIAPKVLRNLASKTLPENFVKLAEQATNMPFLKAVDNLGWNGLIEEIGEERLGDLLKVAFNLDDEDGYNFEQILNAAFPSVEQLGQEAVSFAITGMGMNAVHKGLNKIPKYSKDNFLVDSGIFRTADMDNIIDKKVKSILKKQGKMDEEIENAVNFSTRNDKVEFLRQNDINIEEEAENVKQEFKNDLLNQGVSEDRAELASRIYSAFQLTRSDRTGRSIEELYAEDNLKIVERDSEENKNYYTEDDIKNKIQFLQNKFETLDDNVSKEQVNKILQDLQLLDDLLNGNIKEEDKEKVYQILNNAETVYNQSAYHGTPHKFEDFSTDNIGTGEGVQAHGWGLYFAENKEVSEDYRKTLSKDTILYNKKEYNVRDKEFFVLNNILEKGKKNIIQDKENDLKEQKYILSLEDKKIRKKELEKLEKERKNVLDNREAYPKDSFIKINAMLNNIARMNENKFYFYAIKERTEAIENDIKYIKSIDETKIEKKKGGQLFEVDIPENDVLLDEQKTFSEQSKTVQTGIIRVVDYLYKNQYKYGNIDNLSYTLKTLHEGETKVQGKYDITGGMIYNEISDIIGSAKNTSLMLNNRGIKGITYDGQIDGRCYVIFDDKAVKVLQKYYQADFENLSNLTNEKNLLDWEELYPDIASDLNEQKQLKAEGKLIPTIEINTPERIKMRIDKTLELYGNGAENKNKEAIIVIGPPASGKSTLVNALAKNNGSLIIDSDFAKEKLPEFIQSNGKRADQVHLESVDIANAVLDIAIQNGDNVILPIVGKGENSLTEKLNTLKNAGYKVHLKMVYLPLEKTVSRAVSRYRETGRLVPIDYIVNDVGYKPLKNYVIMKMKGLFDSYEAVSTDVERGQQPKQLEEQEVERLFNEKVQQEANNTGSGLVQRPNRGRTENNQKRQLDGEQINVFPGNMQARKIRKVKGSYIPAENIIELFKNADESTIVHEFAHWYLDNLIEDSKYSEASKLDLEAVKKLVRNNGENFTTEQHEKFARAFEVYIRSGYAKNNRLKKIFEDFRNALLAIYDTIKQIIFTEEGVEKSFTEEDLPQINALFERLLSTENERIKATVFDKIDEIEDKIKVIKDNEQKEFDELDKFWQSNINLLNRQSDKKRQVDEYLKLAEKMTTRETKEIKEFKKRYKNATFEILETATGYDRRFIANPKNWEKIQEKIANTDDKITTSNGFVPSWGEFYSDTGVSYENEEVGGDYKLAELAFNVMTDGNYNKTYDEYYQFDDVEKFLSKFEYLHAKIKTLQGDEKQSALEALFVLVSEMPAMPDDISADIHKKMIEIGDEFEEDSKNAFNKKTLSMPQLIWELQYKITKKLDNLKVYNPETRYRMRLNKSHKLYRYIKDVNSVNDAKRQIRKINNFIIDDMRNNQRSLLHKEIQRQVKINSKVVKTGTIKHGKFDWRTNTVFAELSDMNKLTREAAEKDFNSFVQSDRIEETEERDTVDENNSQSLKDSGDFQELLKKEFLQYKKSRTPELDVQHTRLLLSHILELKFEGRRAKSEEELKKKLNRYDYENDLIDILYKNKNNKIAKLSARWVAGDTLLTSEATLANWETLLNTLFNKETAEKYSLLNDEAQAEVYAHNKCLELYKKIAHIYNLENQSGIKGLWNKALDYDTIQPIINLFNQYDNEIYTYTQKTYNKNTGKYVDTAVDLSRSEIITLYAWSLNEELEQRIFTQFGLEQTKDMFAKLSKEDKDFAFAMVDICDSMYEDTNEVFIRTTGLSLPRVQNYIPSKTERVLSDIDMLHEAFVRSNNPSFIKQRKTCNRIKMSPQSPLSILIPHINKTARYIVLSEKVNFYNKIFGSADVKNAMIDVFRNTKKKGKNASKSGEKLYQILLNQLATSTFENYARSVTVGKNLIDSIASNYISSRIGGNLKVMFSQLTSVINYTENMPSVDWGIGFAKALSHPKETIKFMLDNCDYLKTRLAGNSQNEIISRLTSESDRFRSIRNFCTMNTRYGDIAAIIFGGKPYVDYLMNEQGLSKEEAFKKFIESTLRSQQSGHNSATSAWQKKQAENAFTRMLFAFNNTNLQYERKWVDSISQVAKGDISKGEFIKAFLIYKVFNPILFTSFLTNLSIFSLVRALFGGGDDDELKNAGIDIATSIILSNLKGYGIIGVLADSIAKIAIASKTKDKYFDNSLPLISDFEDIAKKLFKDGELSFEDYAKITASVTDYTTPISATRLMNVSGGLYDISQGNYGIGALETIGYGNYRATLAMTGKPPKQDKKSKGVKKWQMK